MILFKKLTYKNFLSVGDKPMEYQLDQENLTLIVGKNGSGKSSIEDAISFALFGKPHRNINKGQLVNSINKKNCFVELTFAVGTDEFMVQRGIKPNIFNIYKNGFLINQDSHSRDYQKVLEQNILKLNYKSFHQVVVLGASSFIPFMQLSAANRREVIEDLLDISIFSRMNVLVKDRISKTKKELSEKTLEVDHTKKLIQTTKKYLSDIENIQERIETEKKEKVASLTVELTKLETESAEFTKELEKLSEQQSALDGVLTSKKKLLDEFAGVKQDIKRTVTDYKFFNENSVCPSCKQRIQDDFKKGVLAELKSHGKDLQESKDELTTFIDQLTGEEEELSLKVRELSALATKVSSNQRMMLRVKSEIKELESKVPDDKTDEYKNKLTELTDMLISLEHERFDLTVTQEHQRAMLEILKDTGIKTKIINQYVPIINQLVNEYLKELDFFVSFELDESFNEVIRSRHRDDFSYASFSEGEKSRIDLAMLFTWRKIARLKNSISTNLLILDETFDSSLDVDGMDNLLKILSLESGDKSNVIIITHKIDSLEGVQGKRIEIEKTKNFSLIKSNI